ncbi:hypothetical protein ABBQ32_012307 [Trebouxia sp. C0010 RCD-2024]
MGRNSEELTYALLRNGPPIVDISASTPGPATSAVLNGEQRAWEMRKNYIEYHLRLQENRPQQGKLFSKEYPEPSTPPGLVAPADPSAEDSYSSFGSEHESALASATTHTTSVAQTIFNVVSQSG